MRGRHLWSSCSNNATPCLIPEAKWDQAWLVLGRELSGRGKHGRDSRARNILGEVWYWVLVMTNVFVSLNPGELLFSSSDGPLS